MKFKILRKSGEWQLRCDEWLAQFSEAEIPTASLLLDSIEYITHEEVCTALNTAAKELIENIQDSCALYPVTDTKKLDSFQNYQTFPLGKEGDVGSEGDIGHLCRDISQALDVNKAWAFPCLETLRDHEIHHIILLTDTTSSGEQGLDYLDWLWSSKTIKSWKSSGILNLHYITYLYNPNATNCIANHASKPKFKGLQACEIPE